MTRPWPEPEEALGRALSTLAYQPFAPDHDANGKSIGGRWGGVLEGEWDTAMQVMTELLLRQGLSESADVEAGDPPRLDALLGHVHALLASGVDATDDTLRINYLALMVLMRRAAQERTPLWVARAKQCLVAARLFADEAESECFLRDAWSAEREAGWSARLVRCLEACTCELPVIESDRVTQRLRTKSESSRKRRRAQLIRRLRGFVVLAALPRSRHVPGRKKRAYPAAVDRALGDLQARLTGGYEDAGDWPPWALFSAGNPVVLSLYFVVSRALGAGFLDYDGDLDVCDSTFDGLMPSGPSLKKVLKSLGSVAQVKDLFGGLGLLAIPGQNLGSQKAHTWKEFTHEARGPLGETLGLYCYLPFTTGVAITALDRYAQARSLGAKDHLRASLDQSLGAMRALRVPAGKLAHALPFAQYTVYNEIYLGCWLLVLDASERGIESSDREINALLEDQRDNSLKAVEYILAARSENWTFHQCFGANEPDEGENAGRCLRVLAEYSRKLAQKRHFLKLSDAARLNLQREIAYVIENVAVQFVDQQNESGGFSTFEATDREKRGLLGTGEGNGPQEMFIFDASAADTTAWMIEGLAEVSSRGRPIPRVNLRASLRREADHAIRRAVGWLRRDFHPRAGWWARYGGGYVTGTSMALRALRAAGVKRGDPLFVRTRALLEERQNQDDGGWGQKPAADDAKYNDRPGVIAMRGTSDPELTGLALMGLLDCGAPADDPHVLSAVRYLVDAPRSSRGFGWPALASPHSFMQFWNYKDQTHSDLRPAEALLRWRLATWRESR